MRVGRFARPGARWRVQMFRRWSAALALAGVACEFTTDPALPRGATRLAPPVVFARWWAMTEACSGLHGDLSAVTWYVATDFPSISDGHEAGLAGYYSPTSNRIVLADTADVDGADVRHEMLHALLGPGVVGHPREQFLGRCAGIVRCIETCIADAGPAPAPDPTAVTVGPEVLRVAGAIDPVTPHRAIDDGWFTFTILVTNPRPTSIRVALAPSGDPGAPVSFSWDATCASALGSCGPLAETFRDARADDPASASRFAPGETKRFVVDFKIGPVSDVYWTLPPAVYVFTGYYNGRFSGHTSPPDTVVVGP